MKYHSFFVDRRVTCFDPEDRLEKEGEPVPVSCMQRTTACHVFTSIRGQVPPSQKFVHVAKFGIIIKSCRQMPPNL